MSNTPAKEIVWIDCEMTGLDVDKDGLCEIAIIVTDFELNILHSGFDMVINPGQEKLDNMGDFVRNMHEKSGLLPKILVGATVEEAEEAVIEYVQEHVSTGSRPLVAGNTIGMDRRFIGKYMPNFDAKMHYRSIDVSTVKELSRRWHPKAFSNAPAKNGGHRALADIFESIKELAYFRSTVFVDSPGPDSATAKKAATETAAFFEGKLEG